jgi:hypothetical protein
MFLPADRIAIWQVLDLPKSQLPTIQSLLDAIETEGIDRENQCLEVLTKLKTTRTALANQSDKQAGLKVADVLEFDPLLRMCQLRGGRAALKRELARLIDYPLPEIRITAF